MDCSQSSWTYLDNKTLVPPSSHPFPDPVFAGYAVACLSMVEPNSKGGPLGVGPNGLVAQLVRARA